MDEEVETEIEREREKDRDFDKSIDYIVVHCSCMLQLIDFDEMRWFDRYYHRYTIYFVIPVANAN